MEFPLKRNCKNCEEYNGDDLVENIPTSVFTRDFYDQEECPLKPYCRKHKQYKENVNGSMCK